jgi:hypothetical protein
MQSHHSSAPSLIAIIARPPIMSKQVTVSDLVLPQLGWSRADFESRDFFQIQLDWPQAANQKPGL